MSNFDSQEPSPATFAHQNETPNDSREPIKTKFELNEIEPLRIQRSGSEASGSRISNSNQDDNAAIEFRAVETIEEFFRPKLQGKHNITLTSQILNTDSEINDGESFKIPGSDITDTNFYQAKPQPRMGFPNMKYLDPEIQGPLVEAQQTFYKNYEAQ